MLDETIKGVHDMGFIFIRELLNSDYFIQDRFVQFNIGIAHQVIQGYTATSTTFL